MSALVVDTSIWVEYFRGRDLPVLEGSLRDGLVLLAPVVAAELLSAPMGTRQRKELHGFLAALPLHPTPLDHWAAVGGLRAALSKRGITISTPDAHIAQTAREAGAAVWSADHVFAQLGSAKIVRLFAG